MRKILDKESFKEAFNYEFNIDNLDLEDYVSYTKKILSDENEDVISYEVDRFTFNFEFHYAIDVFDYMYMKYTDQFDLNWKLNEYDREWINCVHNNYLYEELEEKLDAKKETFLNKHIFKDCESGGMYDELIDRLAKQYNLKIEIIEE